LSIGVVAAGWGLMERIGESANRQIVNRKSANRKSQIVNRKSPRHPVTPSLIAYILLTTAALYSQYYAVFLPIGLTIYAFWRWLRPIAHGEHDTVMRETASTSRGLRSAASTSQGLRSAELVQQGLARVESHLDPAEKQQRDGLALRRWLLAQAAIALLYLPWALYAAPKLTLYVSQKIVADADRPLGLVEYGARHLAAFLIGHLPGALAPYWPLALLLLLPLGLGWGMLLRPRQTTPAPRHRVTVSPCHLVVVVALTALTLGWLISLRFPFFPEHGERLLLLALPPFILLLAGGLDAWVGRRAAFATLALLVATSAASLAAFYTVARYPGDDYRPLIARTIEQGLPEDTIFAVYPWQVGYWRSYGSASGPTARLTPDADWTPAVAATLDDALARGKVWFPAHLALGAILETQVEAHLADRAVPFINEWYGPGTRLSGWAVTAAPQPVSAPRVRFPLRGAAGAAELIGVDASPGPVPAANAVTPITLRWDMPADAPVLAVSVRLVDSIGRIWAQHDYEQISKSANQQIGKSANRKSGRRLPGSADPRRHAAGTVLRGCGAASEGG
ncbi:MAG: 2 protein, partial [Chloroflexota bacterium]|nr:2 protein [Chloroflexota bacterium]